MSNWPVLVVVMFLICVLSAIGYMLVCGEIKEKEYHTLKTLLVTYPNNTELHIEAKKAMEDEKVYYPEYKRILKLVRQLDKRELLEQINQSIKPVTVKSTSQPTTCPNCGTR